MMRIVFDIGGTFSRYAKFDGGTLVSRGKMPTPNHLQGLTPLEINQSLLTFIVKAIGDDKHRISEIGICFAGPVSAAGNILASPNIHGARLAQPLDLQGAVQKLTGIASVRVINDLSAAAFRYIDTYRSFELVTVSTGVGNKVVIDGRLQLGPEGLEGELGHLPAYLPAPLDAEVNVPCTCGFGANHINVISSGRGIEEVAKQLKEGSLKESYLQSIMRDTQIMTAESICLASRYDDDFSRKVIDFCTYPLAHALCLTLTSLYLEKIILIGSVVFNCPYYLESLMNNILAIGVYNFTTAQLQQKIIKGIADDNNGLEGMNRYLDLLV